jgi:hypothetical protein
VPEAGEDPPLGDLNRDFDFRFIPRFRRAGRQDDGAVVLRKFVVGPLHAGLVATRDHDPALELIGLMCPPALCGGRAASQHLNRVDLGIAAT